MTHTALRTAFMQSAIAALAALIIVLPARAATPTRCESLLTFAFPDTTITAAVTVPGGPYVAPDAWHLAFTNLPPSCQVSATIRPSDAMM